MYLDVLPESVALPQLDPRTPLPVFGAPLTALALRLRLLSSAAASPYSSTRRL